MIEKHSKVFVPVSVDTKLPSMDLDRFIAMTDTGYASMFRRAEPNDSKHRGFLKGRGITHWLEEKENVYVLTEQELIALMNSCIHNGMCCTPSNVEEFAKNYIKSKTNPQTENK